MWEKVLWEKWSERPMCRLKKLGYCFNEIILWYDISWIFKSGRNLIQYNNSIFIVMSSVMTSFVVKPLRNESKLFLFFVLRINDVYMLSLKLTVISLAFFAIRVSLLVLLRISFERWKVFLKIILYFVAIWWQEHVINYKKIDKWCASFVRVCLMYLYVWCERNQWREMKALIVGYVVNLTSLYKKL